MPFLLSDSLKIVIVFSGPKKYIEHPHAHFIWVIAMKKENLEILLEDIKGKFDLVLEGHDAIRHEFQEKIQGLSEKVDMNSFEIKVLNKKIDGVEERLSKKIDTVEDSLTKHIDAVAVDLTAHRADTEVHRGYKVCEE